MWPVGEKRYIWGAYDNSLDRVVEHTYSIPQWCKHENGWWDIVRWGPFARKVYCCSDCWTILYGDDMPKRQEG